MTTADVIRYLPNMATDYRIPKAAVAGMNDDGLFWTIIEKAWPDTRHPDDNDKLHNCTPGQRAILVLTIFIREVNNGGLQQFFYNSSGDLSLEVIRAFELLGAGEKAMIVEKAMTFFGITESVPDTIARRKLVNTKSRGEIEASIEPLNKQLYGEEKLWPLFRRYLGLHPDEFFNDTAGE